MSIQEFDSWGIGSSPIEFTTYGVFSLFGKTSHCEWEEQGSNPEVTPKGTIAKACPERSRRVGQCDGLK